MNAPRKRRRPEGFPHSDGDTPEAKRPSKPAASSYTVQVQRVSVKKKKTTYLVRPLEPLTRQTKTSRILSLSRRQRATPTFPSAFGMSSSDAKTNACAWGSCITSFLFVLPAGKAALMSPDISSDERIEPG
jgi:hypothetical protein